MFIPDADNNGGGPVIEPVVPSQTTSATATGDTSQELLVKDVNDVDVDRANAEGYVVNLDFNETELADLGGQTQSTGQFADRLAAFNRERENVNLEGSAENENRFRHNRIREFKVGKYRFRDHLVKVKDSDLEDFFRAVQGLTGPDQLAIVHVKALPAEESVSSFKNRVMRDAVSSDRIPDRATMQRTESPAPAKASPVPPTGGLSPRPFLAQRPKL